MRAQILHTSIRKTRIQYVLDTVYKQKATKTNTGLHFSLWLQGIPSVNMT